MSKKKFTLNETWKLCLSMWRWIAKQIRAGCLEDIDDLKKKWLKEHDFGLNEFQDNCFFCQYDKHRENDCGNCPAKKVDDTFYCWRDDYDFYDKPIAFYNKLVALNRKRKK